MKWMNGTRLVGARRNDGEGGEESKYDTAELKQHGKKGKWRKKNNDKKFITIPKKKVTATTPKNDCRKLNKSAAL